MSRLSPTEAVHPAAARLKRGDTRALLKLMAKEDARAMAAVARAVPQIEAVAQEVARAIACGGRLIYLGAGTSGRLGALDAAECPPTFGSDPRTVVALIAGGPKALTRAVEGAEDDARAGARELARLRPRQRDVVVGISASGGARWVRSALALAKSRGAFTAFVTCNPKAARDAKVDRAIALDTGPEVVAGSTRLKAAAATRSTLSMITTAAFSRLGNVREGRMVSLAATNQKLKDRAVRNVAALSGRSTAQSRRSLARAKGNVAEAVALLDKQGAR